MIIRWQSDRKGVNLKMLGFSSDVIDEDGGVRWVDEISDFDGSYLLHVVRDLDPNAALDVLGATVRQRLDPNQLPVKRPDDLRSIVSVAVRAESSENLLVVGHCDDWTFVFDVSGLTFMTEMHETTSALLSADGRTAASSHWIDANASGGLVYAQSGEVLLKVDIDGINPEFDEVPPALAPAVRTAGVLSAGDNDTWDVDQNLRIVCALAGLIWTPQEFRAQPLIVADFPTPEWISTLRGTSD